MATLALREKPSSINVRETCFSCYLEVQFQKLKVKFDQKVVTAQFLNKLTPDIVNKLTCPSCEKQSTYVPLDNGKWAEELF